MHDLIVVGGGPAGLVATVYAVRQRLNVLLLSENLGGKTEIRSEFPGIGDSRVIRGQQLVDNFKNELSYLDIAHRLVRVRSIAGGDSSTSGTSRGGFVVTTAGGEVLETRSVLIASGCSFTPPRLPGAGRYLLKGIGYSAISYAHLFLDRVAVVIGSGPRSVRSALQLAYSAAQVYLISEQGKFSESERAMHDAAGLAALENVTILHEHRISGFDGDSYAREILVETPEGKQKRIPADGFFLESEAEPNSAVAGGVVEQDSDGFVVVDVCCNTSHRGVFAAGDVTHIHREQVLVAMGEGVKAALSIQEYLFGSTSGGG
jgi:alkyl hydroperoxide reductase subunit F